MGMLIAEAKFEAGFESLPVAAKPVYTMAQALDMHYGRNSSKEKLQMAKTICVAEIAGKFIFEDGSESTPDRG